MIRLLRHAVTSRPHAFVKQFTLAAFLFCLVSQPLRAQADINNGMIRLGVHAHGCLSISPVNTPINSAAGCTHLSIRFMPTNLEGDGLNRSEEGWGIADVTSGRWGGTYGGTANFLTPVSFTSTANSAVSIVTIAGVFEVTHDYRPSAHPNLYECETTIKNISPAPVQARYRRIFDWDLDPNGGSEYVTIQGSANPGILSFTDDGTGTANPLAAPRGTSGDVINAGPRDVGTCVTVDLGTLTPGVATTFKFYYGGAIDRATAASIVSTVGIPVYALISPDATPATVGGPNTFIFGFGPGVVLRESGGSTDVTEGGATDTYTLNLTYAPSAPVTITPSGGPNVIITPATLTFTAADWNIPQTFTVTAVDDVLVEGPHSATITHTASSIDTLYNGIPIRSVNVNVTDNDSGPPPPPPPPPGPPPPPPNKGPGEGTYNHSQGTPGPEGAFGFGGLMPVLSTPVFNPVTNEGHVGNVAFRQQPSPEGGWSWSASMVPALLLSFGGAALVLALAKKVN